jgi:hypothetical protein
MKAMQTASTAGLLASSNHVIVGGKPWPRSDAELGLNNAVVSAQVMMSVSKRTDVGYTARHQPSQKIRSFR